MRTQRFLATKFMNSPQLSSAADMEATRILLKSREGMREKRIKNLKNCFCWTELLQVCTQQLSKYTAGEDSRRDYYNSEEIQKHIAKRNAGLLQLLRKEYDS